MTKCITNFLIYVFKIFSLYFSNLNLKYLKLIKMDITRFVIKLFKWTLIWTTPHQDNSPLYRYWS